MPRLSLLSFPSRMLEASPTGRMMRGIAANLFDKGAVTLIQVFSIAVLTRHWGASGFGIWLMLMTVPSYIALSDLGFGAAASVIVTRSIARGSYSEAVEAIQSTMAFVLCVVAAVSVLVISYAASFVWLTHNEYTFSRFEISFAIISIVFYSIVLTLMSIVTVVYRATHKFAFAITFSGTLILIEGAFALGSAYLGAGIAVVALAILIIRTIGYFAFVRVLSHFEPWCQIGLKRATWRSVRELSKPSAAALALTFATALGLQGMVLSLGVTAGAAAVAVFGATRTISRVPLQLSGLVLRPSLPELTRAFAARDAWLVRRLTTINVVFAAVATIPVSLALVAFGQSVLSWFSHDQLHASRLLIGLLCSSAIVNALWTAIAAPLLSTNRQHEFAFYYLGLSAASVAATLLELGNPIVFAASIALGAEILTLVVVIHKSTTLYAAEFAKEADHSGLNYRRLRSFINRVK